MAGFIDVDLQSIIASAKNDPKKQAGDEAEQAAAPGQETETDIKSPDAKEFPSNFDWGAEYDKRIADNRNLSRDARVPEDALIKQFFVDFFTHKNSVWSDAEAKQLLAIPALHKAIKILGFNVQENPLLAFIQLEYVRKNIIGVGLLNNNTYKAIHTAIVKKLVPDSEFYHASAYNVLYCRNLYKKTPAVMIEYLTAQKSILNILENKITAAAQMANRRAFLQVSKPTGSLDAQVKQQQEIPDDKLPSMMAADAILNDLDLVYAVAGKKRTGKNDKEEVTAKSKKGLELLAQLNTPALILAALQYISMTTSNKDALNAIKIASQTEPLSSVKAHELLSATVRAAKILQTVSISSSESSQFVALLLQKIGLGEQEDK